MQQPTESSQVKVTLLLSGGHEYILNLPSNDPLLENLFKILIARSQRQDVDSTVLLQLMVDGENAALCLPGDHLIGLITEPPLFIKNLPQSNPKPTQVPSPQPASPAVAAAKQDVLISQYVQIDNFLTNEEYEELLAYAIDKEPEFVPTTTSTNADDYRKSLVLYKFPYFADLITKKIQEIVPKLCQKLDIPVFDVTQIEKQLTSHNHGNFYKIHNDNGSPNTATRQLTYVYYFYAEPKPFTGGELVIYDAQIKNNYYVKADSSKIVDPRNNSIVFFLSRCHHEVLPVNCPSQDFADSRFTINGWIRS